MHGEGNKYKGENHAPLIVNGKPQIAEYMGPGTNIVKRAELGIQPLTVVDIVSAIHDCDYWLAQLAPNKEEQLKRVRLADKEMLGRLELTKEFNLDNILNINAGKLGIGAKVKIEKRGRLLGSLAGFATGGPLGGIAGFLAGRKGKKKLEAIAGPLVKHPEKDIQFIRKFRQSKVDEFNKLVGIGGSGILKDILYTITGKKKEDREKEALERMKRYEREAKQWEEKAKECKERDMVHMWGNMYGEVGNCYPRN